MYFHREAFCSAGIICKGILRIVAGKCMMKEPLYIIKFVAVSHACYIYTRFLFL
jgi:hypothetical protein